MGQLDWKVVVTVAVTAAAVLNSATEYTETRWTIIRLYTDSQEITFSTFPLSAPTLLVGRQEVHPACKKVGVGLLVVTI